MPWKGSKDPYVIWLSEIILQQTRVEQGMPYFQRFLEHYPTVKDLAAASQDEVLKLWEGLGYYSRARNLHATARFITDDLGGRFPDDYKDILKLKGVGPYTAAAIASFAFNLPYAVVDGNVFRVLARYFGMDLPIDASEGKKAFSKLADRLLDQSDPARYNQAIMDFGATHCTPKNPRCNLCPLHQNCFAFRHQATASLPVKSKKMVKKERHFHFLVFNRQGKVCIRKRTGKDIWQHLYEFPHIELAFPLPQGEDLLAHPDWDHLTKPFQPLAVHQRSRPFRQVLSHQIIHAVFWEIETKKPPLTSDDNLIETDRKNLTKFAFPKIIDWYLRDKSLYLKLH